VKKSSWGVRWSICKVTKVHLRNWKIKSEDPSAKTDHNKETDFWGTEVGVGLEIWVYPEKKETGGTIRYAQGSGRKARGKGMVVKGKGGGGTILY